MKTLPLLFDIIDHTAGMLLIYNKKIIYYYYYNFTFAVRHYRPHPRRRVRSGGRAAWWLAWRTVAAEAVTGPAVVYVVTPVVVAV